MTDAQFAAWLLEPDAIRTTLVEAVASVSGVETTFYLANGMYVTGAADTPANTSYLPVVSGGVSITESLSVDVSQVGASMNTGDISVENSNGERDAWLNHVWTNRNVVAYIGDPRWPRSDFRVIFSGVIAALKSSARGTLNLVMTDKLQRMNAAVFDTKLGGLTPNKDEVLPIGLGELSNITPLLTDPATLEYQVHAGRINGIIEVRDNAAPVSFVQTKLTGKFTLNASPAGTITCSVQADAPAGEYANTVSKLVQRLATGYGQAALRFTAADLDTANLAAFETANPQPVGTYLSAGENVMTSMQELADSLGATVSMSREGKLRLLKVAIPTSAAINIGPDDMLQNSLSIESRTEVVGAKVIGYNRNYTTQANLQTGIAPISIALFENEWLTATAADASVQAAYRLTAQPAQENTLLLVGTDAQAEALRRLNLYKVQRHIFVFIGMPNLLTLTLGDSVKLTNHRFGLSAGKFGMVVKLQPNWLTGRVTVGVLI